MDRLWVLLESGSTPVARKAAAEQIGEIQKLHQHELHNLLRKVCKYLNNKSWETRVAATQAVEAIAKNVKKWEPPCQPKTSTNTDDEKISDVNDEFLSFENFDINQVLLYGTPLLSSTGDEFSQLEDDPEYQKMTYQEKAAFHRQQLKQKLGLVAQGKVFSTGLEQLFDDEDLISTYKKHQIPKPAKQSISIPELSVLSGMSARERNRARRKAKMAARKNTREKEQEDPCDNMEAPSNKKPRTSPVMVEQTGDTDKVLIDQVRDTESMFEESNEWPFTWFCEEMFHQLFNPQWEFRHGSASALREVIKLHGDTAGVTADTLIDQRYIKTQVWLTDTAIRVLCIFALDRFADFVSDQVIAPVRATCAQVLGIICHLLEDRRVNSVINVLLVLVQQDMWEVRHAALMGIQHLLASRMDLSESLLPVVGDSILKGLQDTDDDVKAVAAGALLPVANKLHKILEDKIPQLVQILWDSLLDLDDLSASTSAIMDLLSNLLISLQQQPLTRLSLLSDSMLSNLIPRIYPFLSHTISSVRTSCLKAIKSLLNFQREENSANNLSTCGWVQTILESTICQIMQCLALEGEDAIKNLAFEVWENILEVSKMDALSNILSVHLIKWLGVLVTPCNLPVDCSLLIGPLSGGQFFQKQAPRQVFLGGSLGVESSISKEQSTFTARVICTRALGQLAKKCFSSSPSSSQYFIDNLRQMASSNSATYKIIASLVVVSWGCCPQDIVNILSTSLTEQPLYEELAPFLLSLQKDCHLLISAFEKKGIEAGRGVTPSGYTADFAVQLATTTYTSALQSLKLTSDEKQEFDLFHRNLLTTLGQLQEQHQILQGKVQCCVAGCVITLSSLPEKLTPLIRPLMNGLKTQTDSLMQSLGAKWLSRLLDLCRERTPCPNPKIIKNLCSYVCCDSQHTPSIHPTNMGNNQKDEEEKEGSLQLTMEHGIISLLKNTARPIRTKRGPGRPSAAVKEAMAEVSSVSSEEHQVLVVQRRGGEAALTALAEHFESSLFSALPQLWSQVTEPLNNLPSLQIGKDPDDRTNSAAQSVINALQVLEVLTPAIHEALKPQMLSLLPLLLKCLVCSFTAIRHMAARCITSFARLHLHHTMQFILKQVLPFLGDSTSITHRQGAIEAVACLLDDIGLSILCYIVLLIMPVLSKMSDQQQHVRLMASQCFASLVTLMPLESGVKSPSDMLPELAEKRKHERQFLQQLLDTSKLESYHIPVPINADLRKYQQDGVNWLSFLNKYNLHGILCDDMGLGKTLQSICIIAGDHYMRGVQFRSTGKLDSSPLPSIVVCPPTLTGHWVFEVKKFCSSEYLNPLQYAGPPTTRIRLQKQVPLHNLTIVSYDIVRNDIDFFRGIHWNYCVLDEGHIIKNTKTKITKAVKQLKANHRLILSGTPIQNNVLELWSLFDFLMPGFLGTEQQFNSRFGRPIILSRDAKSSSKEQEAGALAMEGLHRQVLPFLLRRMKEDVLQDLPPKIIQDYHCDLSPLQVQLYEDFARSRAKKQVEEVVGEEIEMVEQPKEEKKPADSNQTHIFQALQYLRKVCNHPVLVVTPEHPMYSKVMEYLRKENSTLHDIAHSAKLLALKQLLHECGIGVDEGGQGNELGGSVVSQHRVLLFCQYKSMLDIIEKDLLKSHMPGVTFMRLDGSVPANNRHGLVQRFNMDPSIDLLLLTTHVGGLGLNLTGADTVIFFEHDWNPMKDLQAMDRAHRIGQKRVVNVYRLITRGTLEEKIMSLQKFKLNIANTVITQENSSLLSMNTSDILDLFQLGENQKPQKEPSSKTTPSLDVPGSGLKSVLGNLPELWNEEQYSEYDVGKFMQSLSTANK